MFIERPAAKDPEEAKAFIQKITENKSYYWGITLKENGKMIGTICFWNLSADRKALSLAMNCILTTRVKVIWMKRSKK